MSYPTYDGRKDRDPYVIPDRYQPRPLKHGLRLPRDTSHLSAVCHNAHKAGKPIPWNQPCAPRAFTPCAPQMVPVGA